MIHYKKIITVTQKDIDLNGHVGNIRYLEWFLAAAEEHSVKLGVGFEALKGTTKTLYGSQRVFEA